jgi:cell division protein FtsL
MPAGKDKNNKVPGSGPRDNRGLRPSPALVLPGLKVLLLVAVVASALGVAFLAQQNRQLFAQAEILRREEAALDARWSRLLLERGTLTAQVNIEKEARALGMHKPLPAEVVVVR